MSGGTSKSIGQQWAGLASIGAGVIHGAAIGLHADHAASARVFLVLTLLQVGWGIAALTDFTKYTAWTGLFVSGGAVVGWVITRTSGISFISGLEIPESPQPADSLCALLGGITVLAILWGMWRPENRASSVSMVNASYILTAITLAGLWTLTGHAHSHGVLELTDSALSINADGVIVAPSDNQSVTTTVTTVAQSLDVRSQDELVAEDLASVATTVPKKSTTTTTTTTTTVSPTTTAHAHTVTRDQQLAAASGWPKAFDPSAPIDFSGIGGVTAEQAARATNLIQANARDLAKYANTADAYATGYRSIGDGSSGYEHYIKQSLIVDNRMLDTTAPESLVYKASGATRTLVSAMYIANPGTLLTDATLNNYAGGLMQWHVHNNLCWAPDSQGNPKVVAVTNAAGICPFGVRQPSGAPMVHVWLAPHPCGPFAAVEGVAAGVADVSDSERVDLCSRQH
jgi:hypothetical protein